MNTTWKRRLNDMMLPLCAVIGVLAAFGIVLAWFPQNGDAWSLPLQEIDAPAHYYFIRRILREGIGAATHLWPNNTYYPPMFHLAAAAIIAVGQFLGVNVNIYTAFNLVWLFTSGLVWPAGVALWASYWTRRVDGTCARRPFSCAMMLIVPSLAVASASHPFQMLASGPLIAFGLATTLLPYWLYATLRLFDAIAQRSHIVRWVIIAVLLGLLCVFAHPRIAFTWLLLMAPFILLRLPWKLILGAFAAVVVCCVAFFFYMIGHYHSSRYLDPSSWFHTYVPNRTVPDALRVLITDNIGGPAGWFMAAAVIVALFVVVAMVVAFFKAKRSGRAADTSMAKDAASLILAFLLVALVYVCSTSLTGWFPNIVAGAWYRAETRPLTMIPFGIIPLLVFAVCAVASLDGREGRNDGGNAVSASHRFGARTVAVVVLAALVVACQFGNTTRETLGDGVAANMTLSGKPEDEQLTPAKYDVLRQTVAITGTDALIISDPLNGSMYGSAIFDANMLFPIYNAMHEKDGAIFTATEGAFNSGLPTQLSGTACPIDGSTPKYFLSMGPQAPSLQMFTFRQQYDTFHRQDLIDGYVASGTLVKVKDFSSYGPYAKDWALYRIQCGK